MKFYLRAISAGVLMATATVSMAEVKTSAVRDNGLSYSYIQGGLAKQSWDFGPGDWDATTLGGNGSFALDEHLFMLGGLSIINGDNDIDGWQFGGGLGFHTPLQSNLDLVVSGELIYTKLDLPVGDDNELGLNLDAGVRLAASPQMEVAGGLYYVDYGFSNWDDMGLFGDALFHASGALDLGVGLKLGGDLTEIGAFVRYNL